MSAYLDYSAKIDFDQKVYVYHDEIPNLVVEYTLGELASKNAEETTTPRGIGNKYFTEDKRLYCWLGSNKELIEEFDTEEDAKNAWLISALHDLNENCKVSYFNTIDELYEYISDCQDPDDYSPDELINKEKLKVITESEACRIKLQFKEKMEKEKAENLYNKVVEKFDYTPDFESKEGVKLYKKLAFCVKNEIELDNLDFTMPKKELNSQIAKFLGNSAARTGSIMLPVFVKKQHE